MSNEEITSLAKSIESKVQQGDAGYLTSRIDMAGIGTWATQNDRSPTSIGFRNGLLQARDIIRQQLENEIQHGGTYTFLAIKGDAPSQTIFFRLISGQGALNYHELRVVRKEQDDFLILDLLPFTDGDWMSQTSKRNFDDSAENIRLAANPDPTEKDRAILEGYKQFGKMTRIFPTEPIKALEIYDALPKEIQQTRMVRMLRLQAAMRAGDDAEYMLAMEDFQKAHPEDAGLRMVLIDSFFMKQRYDDMIDAIDKLEEITQVEDPYLNVLRGVGRRFQGRNDEAAEFYRKAAAAEPNRTTAFEALLDMGVVESRYDLVAEALTGLEKQGNVDVDEIVARDAFEEFRLSDAHQEWQKSRTSNEK